MVFVWELTKETTYLTLGCLQGGFRCPVFVLDLAGIRRNCGTNQRAEEKDELVLL